MITTDRQYKAAQIQAEKLRRAADAFDERAAVNAGTHPQVARAHLASLRESHAELCGEIAAYEALTKSPTDMLGRVLRAKNLTELPKVLINARIAMHLTQGDLATLLGMKEQQIQRYEANLYHGASLARLNQVAEALNISFSLRAELGTVVQVHAPVVGEFLPSDQRQVPVVPPMMTIRKPL
jgi:HTH-type transcriptional regulator / antitoxin HigA